MARSFRCFGSAIRALLLLACCSVAPAAGPAAARLEYEDIHYDAALYGPDLPLAELIQKAGLVLDQEQHLPGARLEIIKSTYSLRLFAGDSLLKTYRIQLGKWPTGAKTRRNDGRTPVGSYRICGRNGGSRYYLSLQIDYPNEQDIRQGLETKAITLAQAEALRAELASGKCPTGRTRLGGEIFIHGQHPNVTRRIRGERRRPSARNDLQRGDLDPSTLEDWYNWTLGCIALTNPDIRELFRCLPDGTPVEIRE